MSNWQIQTWNGSAWTTATNLDNPSDVTVEYTNTDKVSTLLSGEEGRISESTVVWSTLQISWQYKTKTFRDTVVAWLTGNKILKLTDNSTSTITYIVKVNRLQKNYIVLNGAIGYQLDANCSQTRDPSV